MEIPAGQFKARCLKIIDDVRKDHGQVVITKFGKPVAKLVPVEGEPEKPLFGFLRGTATIHGDIVAAVGESWNVDE